ncbi:hypothetical protein CHARACLAT_031109 [Characodon lateralis]|uniref:Uncharacterized protein n=1 Tax=Characodon lateralis TaxID=208331 RepID=A0ABU7DVN3_9TELE|nr:hypothetical protein [Characodon lateralis]
MAAKGKNQLQWPSQSPDLSHSSTSACPCTVMGGPGQVSCKLKDNTEQTTMQTQAINHALDCGRKLEHPGGTHSCTGARVNSMHQDPRLGCEPRTTNCTTVRLFLMDLCTLCVVFRFWVLV